MAGSCMEYTARVPSGLLCPHPGPMCQESSAALTFPVLQRAGQSHGPKAFVLRNTLWYTCSPVPHQATAFLEVRSIDGHPALTGTPQHLFFAQARQESVLVPGTLSSCSKGHSLAYRITKGTHSWLSHHPEAFCSSHECNISFLVVAGGDGHRGPAHS